MVLVVPAELARRCLYTLGVIAAALAQWSHGDMSAAATRSMFGAFSILGEAARGWPSLVRWTGMAMRLWPRLGSLPCTTPRALAYVISAKLCAFAPVPLGRVQQDCVAGSTHAC